MWSFLASVATIALGVALGIALAPHVLPLSARGVTLARQHARPIGLALAIVAFAALVAVAVRVLTAL